MTQKVPLPNPMLAPGQGKIWKVVMVGVILAQLPVLLCGLLWDLSFMTGLNELSLSGRLYAVGLLLLAIATSVSMILAASTAIRAIDGDRIDPVLGGLLPVRNVINIIIWACPFLYAILWVPVLFILDLSFDDTFPLFLAAAGQCLVNTVPMLLISGAAGTFRRKIYGLSLVSDIKRLSQD